jgi:hypothetical protein
MSGFNFRKINFLNLFILTYRQSLILIMTHYFHPSKPLLFDDDRLSDLAMSIQTHGVLQPIVLRQTVQGYYIVVGERRFRASQSSMALRSSLCKFSIIANSIMSESDNSLIMAGISVKVTSAS